MNGSWLGRVTPTFAASPSRGRRKRPDGQKSLPVKVRFALRPGVTSRRGIYSRTSFSGRRRDACLVRSNEARVAQQPLDLALQIPFRRRRSNAIATFCVCLIAAARPADVIPYLNVSLWPEARAVTPIFVAGLMNNLASSGRHRPEVGNISSTWMYRIVDPLVSLKNGRLTLTPPPVIRASNSAFFTTQGELVKQETSQVSRSCPEARSPASQRLRLGRRHNLEVLKLGSVLCWVRLELAGRVPCAARWIFREALKAGSFGNPADRFSRP